MKCQKVQECLLLYSGDDLRSLRKNRIRHHLKECEACRLELAKLQKTRELTGHALRQKEIAISDGSLWERILYNLPRNNMPNPKSAGLEKPSRFHRFAPLLIGTAVMVIMLLMGDGGPFMKRLSEQPESVVRNFPVVEKVNKPGVTVMTFQTEDPKVTIVWFFEEESNQNSGGQNETST